MTYIPSGWHLNIIKASIYISKPNIHIHKTEILQIKLSAKTWQWKLLLKYTLELKMDNRIEKVHSNLK